jgi:hypothetical protein
LTQEHVELAASLGHATALELFPDVGLVDWTKEGRAQTSAAADLLGETLPARVAADWAERVLPILEARTPHDERPREAIEAARSWANCPCPEHRNAAEAANDAANASASAGPYAEHAAAAAAAAAYADHAVNYAYNAAKFARSGAEWEWQRLRLAAYVLGEVETDEPAV